MTYYDQRRAQGAMRDYLREMQPNLFITHNFFGMHKAVSQISKMTLFYSSMQRKAWGRGKEMKSTGFIPTAYGFREHPHSNPHYHVIAKLPKEMVREIEQHGRERWKRIARGGQLWVEPINSGDTRSVAYSTYDYWTINSLEDMFVYSGANAL